MNAIGASLAEAADAALVATCLEQATTDEVRDKALWVAYGVFGEAQVPDRRLVDVVSRFVFDPSLAGHHQTALRVLGERLGREANALLVRAVRGDDWDVQVHAAWQLSRPERLDEHRDLLEQLVEDWPVRVPSSPHHAEWVRETVLGGMHSVHWQGNRLADPVLYRAHRELRAPTGVEAYQRAFLTLLHSGQTVAGGVALDHWYHEKGIERHGGEQDARQHSRAGLDPHTCNRLAVGVRACVCKAYGRMRIGACISAGRFGHVE